MRETIEEAVFDGLAQNLEELSFAAPLFGRYIPNHIDSNSQIRMVEESDRKPGQVTPDDALAAAYTLNLLYVDALIGNKVVLRIVEEQVSAAAAARKGLSKDFVMTFLVNATVVCGRCISSLSLSRPASTRDAHSRAILYCGALSGLGLLLGLTADRGPTSPYLSEQQASLLKDELSRMPMLARPQGELAALAAQLDQLTTQSYDAPTSSKMSENAPLVFWLLQIFNLYSDVANLLKTLQATDHPLRGLKLIGLHDTCLRAKSGTTAVAEAKVSSWIVGVHAGLVQNLSPDTMCWLAIYLMNSNKMEATRIVDHMLTAVFKDYFAGGRLSVSGTIAFGGSQLGSSTETFAILLYCDLFRRVSDYRKLTGTSAVALGNLRPSVFVNHFDPIIAHLRWLMGKEEQGLHSEDEQTAEAAFARIAFVACSNLLCEELLNRHARRELEVQLRLSNPKGEYPSELEFVVDAVIQPIKAGGEARSSASYSMVLYGPPGTAKTTLAKKIAYDLDWPFLEIAQRNFLREGSDRIDAQADKIFRYCGYLRDVVILFDELEELILDRETLPDKESRLLTTSMLPRIQQLRDRRAVVFIFATNRLSSLDLAATRLGRFDIIKYVRLPALERRVAMLMSVAEASEARYPVLARALKTFAGRPDIGKLTDKMAYSDVNYMLGQVRRLELAQKKTDNKSSKVEMQMAASLGKEIEMIFSRHKTSVKLSKALKECERLCKLDRPPS